MELFNEKSVPKYPVFWTDRDILVHCKTSWLMKSKSVYSIASKHFDVCHEIEQNENLSPVYPRSSHERKSESKIKRESPRNSLLRNQNLCFGSEKKWGKLGVKLSIIESGYQKALFLGSLKSLKINYTSKFYVIKVVESKFEVLKS